MGIDDSPFARAATDYIGRGLAVIPLSPGRKEPVTKHGINDWTDNPGQVPVWWGKNPRYNVGLVMGQPSGGIIAIDLDVHDEGASGVDFLKDWEVEHGELPETWKQVTGSGGVQLFYRADREVRNSANPDIGVDIRGDGGFVVAPPSIHPCGDAYEWSVSPDDVEVADADRRVWAFIDAVRPTRANMAGAPFALPERIAEGGRNDTLFKYGCSLRSRGLSDDEVSNLMEFANLKCCKPPLDSTEVSKCIKSVVTKYAPGNSRTPVVEPVAVDAELMGQEVEKGQKRADCTSMDVVGLLTQDTGLMDGIRFDVHGRRPWKVARIPGDPTDGARPLDDNDMANIWGYCEQRYGIRNRATFDNAFMQFVTIPQLAMDRLRDAMSSLPLVERREGGGVLVDGEPKTETAGWLFAKYLGCEPSEYVYQAELLTLRQIVARALFPGCKADVMPILTGAQGIGKSTFVEKLAVDPALYLSSFSKFDEEHKRRLAGKLVVEVGELDAFGRSEMSSIKEAITDRYDETRQPYARYSKRVPRTCVFIGTTNEGRFLTDTTGNRRFLPIECGRDMCRPEPGIFNGELDADIRQAYGEILLELREQGREAFLSSLVLPEYVQKEAMEQQAEFTQEDTVLADVENYLDTLGQSVERVCVKMVMCKGMGYTDSEYSRAKRYERNDVARALDKVPGWRKMKGKQRVPGYGIAQAWQRENVAG